MGARTCRKQNELRADLLALARACPFDRANPEDCPLFPLRKMKRNARLQWCDALDASDLSYLAAYHHVCMKFKVDSQTARMQAR
jgi:hypothetical protein